MRVVQIEPVADTHFHRAHAGFSQRFGARCGRDVAADDLQIRVFGAGFADALQHAFGVAVRGVDQQNVNACRHQRVNSLFVAGAGADRRAHAQTAVLVFTGVRFAFRFLEVFNGDHAQQVEAVVHHQRFFYALFVHLLQHHVARFTFFHGDQAIFRRHDRGDRLAQIGHEAHVAAGDDANQLVVFGDNRVTGEAVARSQLFHFLQRGGRGNGLRVGDYAAFMLLHAADFFSLALDRHVFVDEARAAFLRQRNGQSRIR